MLQSHAFSGARGYAARGRFFLYQSSNAAALGADERIAVEVDGQPLGDFYVGDSIELPVESDSWRVTPYTAGLSGMVVIGDGSVRTNRVAGAIKIIDNGVELSMGGKQYMGTCGQVANATKCSMVGLFANTSAFSVRSLVLSCDVTGSVSVLSSTGTPTDTAVDAGFVGPKLLGTPTVGSVRRWRALCAATVPTTVELPGMVYITSLSVKATEVREVTLRSPIIVPLGMGLFFTSPVINAGLTLNAEVELLS